MSSLYLGSYLAYGGGTRPMYYEYNTTTIIVDSEPIKKNKELKRKELDDKFEKDQEKIQKHFK